MDSFVGVWRLDPQTLDYQFGRPGRRALYTISKVDNGLEFTLDADDTDGKPMHFVYGGELDGLDKPIAEGITLAMTKLTETIIESTLKRNGTIVDRWTRELSEDGTYLTIIQHGVNTEGQEFRNLGIYRRQ